jgi:hypothetical protein
MFVNHATLSSSTLCGGLSAWRGLRVKRELNMVFTATAACNARRVDAQMLDMQRIKKKKHYTLHGMQEQSARHVMHLACMNASARA